MAILGRTLILVRVISLFLTMLDLFVVTGCGSSHSALTHDLSTTSSSQSIDAGNFCTTAGTLDDSCVTNAIHACPQSGTCSVSLSAGEYTFSNPVVLSRAGVVISCAGVNSATITVPGNYSAFIANTNTIIRNCHFVGDNSLITPHNHAIDSGGTGGIPITGVQILSNDIERFDVGINTGLNTAHWTISGNTIHDNVYEGMLLGANTYGLAGDTQCAAEDNCGKHSIINNIIFGNGRNGIDVNSSFNDIEDNTVYQNGGTGPVGSDRNGILLYSVSGVGSVDHNVVHSNTIYSNNTDGLQLGGGVGGSVSFNEITNNNIYSNGNDGLHVVSGGGQVSGNTVNSNQVTLNTKFGILLDAYNSGELNNTMITNNLIKNNTAGNILVLGATGTVVKGNN